MNKDSKKLQFFKNYRGSKRGFTFIEVLVVIAIFLILSLAAVVHFRFFEKKANLESSVEKITADLKLAQNRTLSSEGASQWGVYFLSSTSSAITLFKGSNFASRAPAFDEVFVLPNSVEIYDIDLGGGNEIVFDRLTGISAQQGKISLRSKNDFSQVREIYIDGFGGVSMEEQPDFLDDDRIKDSRHIHIDYTRSILVDSEDLILTFTNGSFVVVKTIPLVSYIFDGQFSWEEEINVDGDIQKIKIHTHRLNEIDGTQFCVHRDRELNNKPLKIELSGDLSGDIINYSADGTAVGSNSVYVSNTEWQ